MSCPAWMSSLASAGRALRGQRIGVPAIPTPWGTTPAVQGTGLDALAMLESIGAGLVTFGVGSSVRPVSRILGFASDGCKTDWRLWARDEAAQLNVMAWVWAALGVALGVVGTLATAGLAAAPSAAAFGVCAAMFGICSTLRTVLLAAIAGRSPSAADIASLGRYLSDIAALTPESAAAAGDIAAAASKVPRNGRPSAPASSSSTSGAKEVPETIVPLPKNGMLPTNALPIYATAFANAVDETERTKPGTDMFQLLKAAAVKEQYAIKKNYSGLRPKVLLDAAMARAAVVNQWLVDIRQNKTPAPWGRDLAMQILNNPKVTYRNFTKGPGDVVGPINPQPGDGGRDPAGGGNGGGGLLLAAAAAAALLLS